MTKGLTPEEQQDLARSLHAQGYTVVGWARAEGYNQNSVRAVFYSDYGRGSLSPTAEKIVVALRRRFGR